MHYQQLNRGRIKLSNFAYYFLLLSDALQRKEMYNKWTERRKKMQTRSVSRPKASLINDKSDWNGNMWPFRGTSQLYDLDDEDEADDYDDSEWLENVVSPVTPFQKTKHIATTTPQLTLAPLSENKSKTSAHSSSSPHDKTIEVNVQIGNALGSLMSAYDSCDSDDEPPLEIKVAREDPVPIVRLENPMAPPVKIEAPSTSSVKENNHENVPVTNVEPHKVRTRKRRLPKKDTPVTKRVHKPVYKKRRLTLLERLLEPEIQHERNVILQCVRYVVKNNYFDKLS